MKITEYMDEYHKLMEQMYGIEQKLCELKQKAIESEHGICNLGLTERTKNTLLRSNILFKKDLATIMKKEDLHIPGLGLKGLQEIDAAIKKDRNKTIDISMPV